MMLPGVLRTLVPMLVTWLVGIPLVAELNVDQTALENALAVILGMIYYVVIRQVEKKFPKAGILLGYPAAPKYDPELPANGAGN